MTVKPLMYIKVTEASSGLIHALTADGDVVLDVLGIDQENSYLQDSIAGGVSAKLSH